MDLGIKDQGIRIKLWGLGLTGLRDVSCGDWGKCLGLGIRVSSLWDT